MAVKNNVAVGPLTGISFAGGVFGDGGTLRIINSTVSDNSASFGFFGGVYQSGGTANIVNTTISNNSTIGVDGGVQTFREQRRFGQHAGELRDPERRHHSLPRPQPQQRC